MRQVSTEHGQRELVVRGWACRQRPFSPGASGGTRPRPCRAPWRSRLTRASCPFPAFSTCGTGRSPRCGSRQPCADRKIRGRTCRTDRGPAGRGPPRAAPAPGGDPITPRTARLMQGAYSLGSESLGACGYLATGRKLPLRQAAANLLSSTVVPAPRRPCRIMLCTLPRATLRSMSSNARSSFPRPARYGGSRPGPGAKGLTRSPMQGTAAAVP